MKKNNKGSNNKCWIGRNADTIDEKVFALKCIKNRKSPGEDRVRFELLKSGGKSLLQALKIILNKCLDEGCIPTSWQNSEVGLLFKKGDNTSIENYRPISLAFGYLTSCSAYYVGVVGFSILH